MSSKLSEKTSDGGAAEPAQPVAHAGAAAGGGGACAEAKDSPSDEETAEDVMEFRFDVHPEAKALGSPAHGRPAGLGLDLSAAVAGAEPRADDKLSEYQLIERQATQPVLVVFELPDGSEVENEFQMGQTVEVLKSFVALECGIPMEDQRLFLVGPTEPAPALLDPMTLLDYPQIDPSAVVVIRVDGDLMDGAKK